MLWNHRRRPSPPTTLDQGIDAARVITGMMRRRIPVRVYFMPIHQQRYIQDLGLGACSIPVTESLVGRTLALPFHNHLSDAEIDLVASFLEAGVREAAGRRTSDLGQVGGNM